jgi:hypothetical protein
MRFALQFDGFLRHGQEGLNKTIGGVIRALRRSSWALLIPPKPDYSYSLTIRGHFFPFVHHLFCSLSLNAGKYSWMIRTDIVFSNGWGILLSTPEPFVTHGHWYQTMPIFYCGPAKPRSPQWCGDCWPGTPWASTCVIDIMATCFRTATNRFCARKVPICLSWCGTFM